MNRAVDALRSSSYIICDCEGSDLGSRGGNLSIISLAALPTSADPDPRIYLIDAIKLSDQQLQPIYNLLQSDQHTKIMYDARSDWCEFYHRHGVELVRVLDLQLADIESRRARNETQEQQLARLPLFCSEEEVKNYRTSYTKIHRLNGLGASALEHGAVGPEEKGKVGTLLITRTYEIFTTTSTLGYFPHNKWNERPLWKKHIQYAAKDIQLISKLFLLFSQKGYVNETELLAQSARYMTLRRDGPPPPNSGHSLLPLDILVVPPDRAASQLCKSCTRKLALPCFPQKPRDDSMAQTCLVCCAVKIHNAELPAKQKAQGWQRRQKAQGEKRKREEQARSQQLQREQQAGQSSRILQTGFLSMSSIVLVPNSHGEVGIFGYDDEDIPGGTYYRDMYDSD